MWPKIKITCYQKIAHVLTEKLSAVVRYHVRHPASKITIHNPLKTPHCKPNDGIGIGIGIGIGSSVGVLMLPTKSALNHAMEMVRVICWHKCSSWQLAVRLKLNMQHVMVLPVCVRRSCSKVGNYSCCRHWYWSTSSGWCPWPVTLVWGWGWERQVRLSLQSTLEQERVLDVGPAVSCHELGPGTRRTSNRHWHLTSDIWHLTSDIWHRSRIVCWRSSVFTRSKGIHRPATGVLTVSAGDTCKADNECAECGLWIRFSCTNLFLTTSC